MKYKELISKSDSYLDLHTIQTAKAGHCLNRQHPRSINVRKLKSFSQAKLLDFKEIFRFGMHEQEE